MTISLIAAMAENRVIGRGAQLPWRLPADMKHFKGLTVGHTVIMGRKTFDTLNGPLPNRRNVVVTRDREYRREGVNVVYCLADAIRLAGQDDEVFVVGGGEIYKEALPLADRLYLTVVHTTADGDVFFPEFELCQWSLKNEQRHEADDKHVHAFSFRLYERRH
jgi:dihydrofolate reductase